MQNMSINHVQNGGEDIIPFINIVKDMFYVILPVNEIPW